MNHAHYYSRESSPRKKKKDKNIPGQLSFTFSNIDDDLLEIIEENPAKITSPPKSERTCTPEESKAYWEAFKAFLDASGVFARTWHLFQQVTKDPLVADLDKELGSPNLSPEKREQLKEIREGVVRRENAMREGMHCKTPEEVKVKAHNDWERLRSKLNTLIDKASKANISIALNKEEKREWMLNFTLLDDKHQGSKRRNFYKDKFVERALKSIEKVGYAEPVSLMDIEAQFETWQKKYAKRKN